MRALQEGTLKKVVDSMVPAVLGGNISHISTFMFIHPAFSIAQQVLDLLFTRSCLPSIRSDAIKVFSPSGVMSPYIDQSDTPQDQVKKAIASMVGIWPDQVQNLGQLLFFLWFKLKQGFVQVNSPASQLMDHVLLPWIKLEHLELPEAQLEGEGTAIWEDDLGREDSWAGAPSQAVVSFLSLERHGKVMHVCETCVSLLFQYHLQSSRTLQSQRKGPLRGQSMRQLC
ncbi:ral guanine nucleotide dissociation stimulator-like isoform X1 [Pteropus vampyrus]|uniref:Ral guanine nucleotide dissociation stimulator-like isoform X1 n=2 Tax=Pteropus vampyrus TaxID=132908 RepID=A0A6P6C643_PTEVA|nr:ral guanine nucleotide dissociation stimulator-like isoform X1 [Pteropus vampyrus]XP_023382823.1 ral guanine nucleotide dissociation stimulator-like isoform X1 [Pteropus vampyrus]